MQLLTMACSNGPSLAGGLTWQGQGWELYVVVDVLQTWYFIEDRFAMIHSLAWRSNAIVDFNRGDWICKYS